MIGILTKLGSFFAYVEGLAIDVAYPVLNQCSDCFGSHRTNSGSSKIDGFLDPVLGEEVEDCLRRNAV